MILKWIWLRRLTGLIGVFLDPFLHSDMGILVTNWIMGCISSANFSVLINRWPTDFFTGSRETRGLRRVPPLHSLIRMELLSSYRHSFLLCYRYAISYQKSTFLFNNILDVTMLSIGSILPYKMGSIDDGLCNLKDNCSSVEDWSWLIYKTEST